MKRRIVIGAAVLAAAGVLGMSLPVLQRLFGRRRLRFPYLSRPIPPAKYADLASKPGWAKAELPVAEGIKLRGLVRRPSAPNRPWVLFYPGNDECQLERGQGFLMRLGQEQDWGLAVFAYRGYDASDGKSELAGIRSDAPEILAQLCKAERIAAGQVHLAGFSIGGYFSVQAARGAAERGQPAKTLTLLAPVNDIVMYQPSRFEKLSAGEDYQTQPVLPGVPAPVLVLQGAADQTLDGASQGSAIAKALAGRAEYIELPGVGHVAILENEQALAAMRDFVRRHDAGA